MKEPTLGEKISALRAEQRIGLRELGRAVGVTAMHISNLEKGKSMPSPELVQKLAEALNADLDQMLHRANQVDPAVVNVIQSNPYRVPSFLRSAKDLTAEQWEALQKQVDEMNKSSKQE